MPKKYLRYVVCLALIIGCLTSVNAVTDAELEALEKQIEQQEVEEKNQAEVEAKRKAEEKRIAEAESKKKRLDELEKKQRQEELRLLEAERAKLKEEKRELEKARQVELEQKREEEEAKRLLLEEQKRQKEEAVRSVVTLVFFRNQGSVFDGDSALISHNNSQIGSLHSKAFFIYTVPPGKQTFSVVIFKNWTTKKEFEFMPSKTYFIMAAIDWTSVHLTLESVGSEVINELKNTGSIKPQDVLKDFGLSENSEINDLSMPDPLKI